MATVKIQVQSEGFQETQAAFDRLSRAEQMAIARGSAMGNSLKKSAKEGKDGLLSMAASAVGLGTGMAVGQKAIELLTGALTKLHDERERGARLTTDAAPALAKLGQLAGGDPKRLQSMIDEAKKSSLETGITLDQAAALQFELESAGIAGQRREIAALAPVTGAENIGAFAKQAAGVQKAFGAEAGSISNVISKLFVASEGSPTQIQEISRAAALVSPAARDQGISDEETMAAIAAVTPAAGGSAEIAATQLRNFASRLNRAGIKGGFASGAEQIQAMGLDKAGLDKLLGETGAEGFSNLIQVMDRLKQFTARLNEIDSKAGDGFAGGLAASLEKVPELAEPLALERARRRNEEAAKGAGGVDQVRRQRFLEELSAGELERGTNAPARFVTEALAKGGAFTEEVVGARAGTITGQGGERPIWLADFETIFQKITAKLGEILGAPATTRQLSPKAGLEVD